MKITCAKRDGATAKSDLLILAAFKDATKKGKSDAKTPKWSGTNGVIERVTKELAGLVQQATDEGFVADDGQQFVTATLGQSKAKSVALIGLGDAKNQTVDTYRKAGGEAFHLGQKKRAKKIVFCLPDSVTIPAFDMIQAIAEGAILASYRFDRHFTKEKKEIYVAELDICLIEAIGAEEKSAIDRAVAITHGVMLARDLINEGPTELNPKKLAEHAASEAKACGFSCTVLDEKELKKERMNLMLAVANASASYAPPRLVRLEYKPKKASKKTIALIGKGVTFDCGGLDIKTADGMLDMKVDMSGAAAVLGTMCAIAKLKPNVNVIGYMVCVENGISAASYHPGDVIKSRKGLTVEINNTDAEGRLILADAMTYAQDKDQPDVMIDIATLTGACMVALGTKTAGVFTKSDDLCDEIISAGKACGEAFWRLPLDPELRSVLKSQVADMRNSGERWGGAISAALFLEEFVEEKTTWAHLDIAGPASTSKAQSYTPVGGVGFAVRTLTHVILGQ